MDELGSRFDDLVYTYVHDDYYNIRFINGFAYCQEIKIQILYISSQHQQLQKFGFAQFYLAL